MNDCLIDVGNLSKPANTLIEKISDAIGGIFKPYQIRRVAQAEAEAEFRAATQIKITGLQRRALFRFMTEEAKRQDNIEAITREALPQVEPEARPEAVEDDWITNFFDKCRLISDGEMQSVWARILAGEANSPGKFSKRTVNLVASLDKSNAIVFSRLCSFAFNIGGLFPLIYDTQHKIYTDRGVFFSGLSHLESIGLIHFSPLGGYQRSGLGKQGFVHYFGREVWIQFPNPEGNDLKLGHVMLTKAGFELAAICGAQPQEGFVEYVKEKWKSFGYKTEPDEAAADGVPAA